MPLRIISALFILLLVISLPSFAEIYTEWLWFGETGFQPIFLTSLTTKALLGIVAFVCSFAFLFANFRLALRGPDRPFVLFPGGGDIQPIVLQPRHLGFLAAGLSGVLALFISGIVSSQWLVVLQFFNATAFGEVDPILGRDAGFYIFTLPFLDFLRYTGFGLMVLSFICLLYTSPSPRD